MSSVRSRSPAPFPTSDSGGLALRPHAAVEKQRRRRQEEIAERAKSERGVDPEGDAGQDGDASGEHAGGAVDAPEPGRRTSAYLRDEPHSRREAEAHQESGWRQDRDRERRPQREVRALIGFENPRRPSRQQDEVETRQHRPSKQS